MLTDANYKILTVLRTHRHDSTAPAHMNVGGPCTQLSTAAPAWGGDMAEAVESSLRPASCAHDSAMGLQTMLPTAHQRHC